MLVAIPLIFELLFVIALIFLLHQAESETTRVMKARNLLMRTDALVRKVHDVGIAMAGYAVTYDRSTLKTCQFMLDQIPADFQKLEEMVRDDQRQMDILKKVAVQMQEFGVLLQDIRIAVESGEKKGTGSQLYARMKASSKELASLIKSIIDLDEQTEKELLQKQAQARNNVLDLIALGVLANILIAVWLSVFYGKSIVNRLNVIRANSVLFAQQKEFLPQVSGQDEIAELDASFRQMAMIVQDSLKKESAAFDNAADVICSIDTSGKFVKVNKAVEKSWGKEANSLIGKELSELIPREDMDRFWRNLADMKGQGEGPAKEMEASVLGADGSAVPFRWSAHWSDLDACWYLVAHNVKEQRELEKAKREFISMVSHDLRSPLQSIQITLTMSKEGQYGELTSKGQKNVEAALTSADRLISLVNELVEVEAMESAGLNLECSPTAVADIFQHTLRSVRGLMEKNNILVHADDTNAFADCDPDRIVQVLVNLVSNSMKFSPAESEINISCQPAGKEYIRISVKDQGRGIPESLRQRIFDRYKQVETKDRTEKGGTGLGLAICKSIVESHGGKIGVDSIEGQGSTFWFTLPAAESGV